MRIFARSKSFKMAAKSRAFPKVALAGCERERAEETCRAAARHLEGMGSDGETVTAHCDSLVQLSMW